MKSQRDPFDDELRERLQKYGEEPNKELWKSIAIQINSVNPAPEWVVWSNVSKIIVCLTFFVLDYHPEIHKSEDEKMAIVQQHENVNCSYEENVFSGILKKNANYRQDENGKANLNAHPIIFGNLPSLYSDDGSISQIGAEENEAEWIAEIPSAQLTSTLTLNLSDSAKIKARITNKSKALKKAGKPKEYVKMKKVLTLKNPTIYFIGMPVFGYQRIEANRVGKSSIESIDKPSAFSSKRLGMRVELGLEWPISKTLKIFGGILYYYRQQTIDYTEKQLNSTILAPGPNPGEITLKLQYSYQEKSIEYDLKNAGVQLGFLYKLSSNKDRTFNQETGLLAEPTVLKKKKILHWVGAGIEFQKALNKSNEPNGFYNPTTYVFGNVYYRLQYPDEGKLKAVLQPMLNYSFFVNQNLNSSFYVKPYSLGLNFGFTYSF